MYDNFRKVISVDRNYASITVVIMAVIVYGSLYPFAFRANDTPGGAWRALLATWSGPSGRYDVIANVLFYLPLGFFGVRSTGLRPAAARVALVVAAGTALSISMELLQFYDAGRVSAMSDVYANMAGILFGAIAGTILALRFPVPRLRILGQRPFVFVLLMCWLGSRLFPYVPAIHLHKYWTALQPLVVAPAFPPLNVFRHLARWLAVAVLLEELSDSGFGRLAVVAVLPSVLIARVVIDGVRLSPAEVAGGCVAVLIWNAVISRLRARVWIVLSLFAASVVLTGLAPFQFGPTGRNFQWIPFASLMEGSFYIAAPSFLEKAFTGGALVWLMVRAGLRWTAAVTLGATLSMALSLAQTRLPGRAADLTDTLLLILAAVAMRLTGEIDGRSAASEERECTSAA